LVSVVIPSFPEGPVQAVLVPLNSFFILLVGALMRRMIFRNFRIVEPSPQRSEWPQCVQGDVTGGTVVVWSAHIKYKQSKSHPMRNEVLDND
jgi:hypothetical protein